MLFSGERRAREDRIGPVVDRACGGEETHGQKEEGRFQPCGQRMHGVWEEGKQQPRHCPMLGSGLKSMEAH